MIIDNMIPGNVGVRPRPETCRLTAHAAITKGLIYQIDITTATAANYGIATATKAVALTDPQIESSRYVVALEDIDIGDNGKFAIRGWLEVLADAAGVPADSPLSVNTGGEVVDLVAIGAGAAGSKVIATAPEAIAAATAGYVWFDGEGQGAFHV